MINYFGSYKTFNEFSLKDVETMSTAECGKESNDNNECYQSLMRTLAAYRKIAFIFAAIGISTFFGMLMLSNIVLTIFSSVMIIPITSGLATWFGLNAKYIKKNSEACHNRICDLNNQILKLEVLKVMKSETENIELSHSNSIQPLRAIEELHGLIRPVDIHSDDRSHLSFMEEKHQLERNTPNAEESINSDDITILLSLEEKCQIVKRNVEAEERERANEHIDESPKTYRK